ncbi:MAG: NAD-dependent epimerase/dehydratase family protein [Fimbriimonadaceae bacterium]|nr:MAG: NAD-dependent epimerase/dehydratase family protein [Fimbriimonadaceae bacterium]
MNALVTGGAGFIGSHLVLTLANQGHQVAVLDDLSNGLESNIALFPPSVRVVQGSILDESALASASDQVDVIFHLAAVSNVMETIEFPLTTHAVNLTGTLAICETALKTNASIVFSSSAAVYGDLGALPLTEDSSTNPISLYGTQKLAGENYIRNYCRLHNIKATCLRYFNVYGPRQRADSPYSGVISKFLELAKQNLPIPIYGSGEQTRDFVCVHDVVQANIKAAEHPGSGEALNICSGNRISIIELAQLICKITESQSEIVLNPAREGDILHSQGNNKLASERIDFRPQVELEAGLSELV